MELKKIKTRYELNRARKRNQLILGLALIFLMFFSVIGYSFYSVTPAQNPGQDNQNTNNVNYNGYEFTNQNGLWVLNLQGSNFVFRYNPRQVEKATAFVNPVNNYYNQPLYISSENQEAETEIYINLGRVALRTQQACLEDEACENEDLPVKTCADNFIVIRESNTTDIIQKENCVFIQGPGWKLTQLADGFLFKVLGIES